MKNNSEETSLSWLSKTKKKLSIQRNVLVIVTLVISKNRLVYSQDNFSIDQIITITSLQRSNNLQYQFFKLLLKIAMQDP